MYENALFLIVLHVSVHVSLFIVVMTVYCRTSEVVFVFTLQLCLAEFCTAVVLIQTSRYRIIVVVVRV